MNFYEKYIKYKLKYINYKKYLQIGGEIKVSISESNKKHIVVILDNSKYTSNKLTDFFRNTFLDFPNIECKNIRGNKNHFLLGFGDTKTAKSWFKKLTPILTNENLDSYIMTVDSKRLQEIEKPRKEMYPVKQTNESEEKQSDDQQNNNENERTSTNDSDEVSSIDLSQLNTGGFTDLELQDILNSNNKDNNFLTGEPNSKTYNDNVPKWKELPLYKTNKVREFISLLAEKQVILLTSGTGSGKTVLVPKLVLAYNMKNNLTGKIGITNPKILTTVSNAKYAAETLDVQIGDLVSYNHKGSNARIDKEKTKLIYQTDGILLASSIRGGVDYDTIIIDEAHERNVSIDFLLLLLKNHVLKNPQFKLIIMSATINAEVFTSYFNVEGIKFGKIHVSSAPNFAIERHYLKKSTSHGQFKNRIQIAMQQLLKILKDTDTGDIVIFVATVKETYQGCDELKKICEDEELIKNYKITKDICNNLFCIELSAHVSDEQKELAVNIDKYKRNTSYIRKVIFTTNVAESSLTIDGLKYVIDIGDEFKTSYDHKNNKEILDIDTTSKAQVSQRIGRTGRTGPGVAYHMYTEQEYNAFIDYPKTKIESEDIISTILELIEAEKSIEGMIVKIQELITVPDISKIINCLYRLFLLDCITIDSIPEDWLELDTFEKLKSITGNITNMGKSVLKFRSVPIECAYAMILAKYNGCLREIIIIMSMLQEKINDLFIDNYESNLKRFVSDSIDNSSEHITFLNIYRTFHRRENYGKCLNKSIFNHVDETIKDYTRFCKQVDVSDEIFKVQSFNTSSNTDKIKLVLALAYKLNILQINNNIVDSLLFLDKVKKQKIENLFATNITEKTKYVVCHSYLSIMGKTSFTTGTKISEDIVKIIVNIEPEAKPEPKK